MSASDRTPDRFYVISMEFLSLSRRRSPSRNVPSGDERRERARGGGGVLRLIFVGYVPLASQSPYSIILVTLGQVCNFRDPNLVTFYLCIYLINPLNRSS